MAYGDSIQDWLDNPAAAWTAVWARVNVAADRVQVRQQKIPQLEHDLGAAQQRVANMPAGSAKTRAQQVVAQAQNELAALKSDLSSITSGVLEAVATLRGLQARITTATLGQFQILAPVVLVAIIAAAAAALAWSTKFDSKLSLFNAAIKAGLSPADAAKFAGGGAPPGLPNLASFDFTTIALVIGAVILLPTLLQSFNRGRSA